MQPEDIDKLFRDKLQHHAPTPPEYLWAQLEEELQPAKKRPVMWLYAAAAVIALLLVAGAGWLLRGPSLGNPTGELASATTKPATEKKSTKQPTPQATAPSEATSKESEAGPEKLAVAASNGQEPAPAVHAVRPLAPAPGLRRAVARVTLPARPSTPNSLNPRTAPAQAVAVVAPATAQPERLAPAPTSTPKPESSTPALVAAAAPTGLIIVEVRRDHATPGATAFAADGDTGRRRNLGSLLVKAGKKVGNVVLDGRQINLPKVALPEIITAQVEAYTTAPRP